MGGREGERETERDRNVISLYRTHAVGYPTILMFRQHTALPHSESAQSQLGCLVHMDLQRHYRLAFHTVSVSAQGGTVALGKAHTRSAPSFSSLPKVALQTVPMFIWLTTDRSRPWRVECRPLPFSTPLSFSTFLGTVVLWPVHVQKVPQASEHLCPAKL